MKYFLITDNNVIVFQTKNEGYNIITIGYEEYVSAISVTLDKVQEVGVKESKYIFGIPIVFDDKITEKINFYP